MRGILAGTMLMVAGAIAAPLDAQVTLQPGAKVRITAPTAGVERFQGTVIAAGDTVDVARGDARVRVPAAAVTRLELSRGRSRLAGAARGATWGAGIGLGLGALTTSQRGTYGSGTCRYSLPGECEPYTTGEWLAMSTASGAIWGALIGAIVGRERWDTIAAPGISRTSISPWIAPDGRVGIVATVR
jgi:hypothetical protein